jgi:hypothetical protein
MVENRERAPAAREAQVAFDPPPQQRLVDLARMP